jgi:hypothetical protein
MTYDFDSMPVRIEDEGGEIVGVVLGIQSRFSVVRPARRITAARNRPRICSSSLISSF